MMRHLLALVAIAVGTLPGAKAVEWWTDYGAQELNPASTKPAQAGEALTLLAPINGVASGQIAVRHDMPITSLAAIVSPLTGPTGNLAADVVQARYLTNRSLMENAAEPPATASLATITETFMATASPVGVVYLTAHIPLGSKAGIYTGNVIVTSSAGKFTVPLTVKVADFIMPGRSDVEEWISLMQSPAQLSFAYKTEPYGEKHWKAIEASTRLLGDLGHHILFVPVLWHANAGSGPQMIVFQRDGDSLKPDFSRLERYFKMVARECGPQRLLVLGVWGRWLSGARTGKYLNDKLHLTGISPEGKLQPLEWSSDYVAHEKLWREVYEGVAALAKQHLGVEPKKIVLGFADDTHPSEEVDSFWQKITPLSPGWDAWTHNYGGKGSRPAFFQIVDTAAPATVKDLLAWPSRMEPVVDSSQRQQPFYISACRDVQQSRSPAVLYYSIPDLAATPQKTGPSIGFSRIGLDFWPKEITLIDGAQVRGDGFGADGSDTRTHPDRVIRNYRGMLTSQGPIGAVPLIHFDALREGIQAAQARILVVKAIKAEPSQAVALTSVLESQWQSGFRYAAVKQGSANALRDVSHATIQEGWEPLFTAAAAAQRLLGLRERDEASAKAEALRRAGK